MANDNAENLIITIRARAARSNDTVLITEAFVLNVLNEAQVAIVKKIPRQVDLETSDTTTYQLATNQTEINIATLDPAHIGGIWILNGGATRQQGIKYMQLDEFRKKYIPVSSSSASEPTWYTRQGNTLLFNYPVASDYNDLYLHIDYTAWATDLTNSSASTSQLSDSDEGLILYSLARIFDEIAISQPRFEQKALKKRVLFENWLDNYMEYNYALLEESYDEH